MDDERQHLSELLQIYQRRRRALEKQAATLGVHTPPHVQTESEDVQVAIARLEADLHQLAPHRPALPSQLAPDQGAVASPSIQPQHSTSNLPVPLTRLVGREREVAAACTLLRQPNIRLLTLIGPPGVGKTRLGLQVADELRDSFADGAVFVALEPLRDPDLVISTIAQTLGVREAGSQPLVESLKAYLRDKQLLLLLDNCEHVVSAAPRVAEILATAPRLKVLATSRVALHLSGERNFLVLPLPLPDSQAQASLDQLAGFASAQLFIERAQAAQPDFQLTAANAAAVAAICMRLEGLPLAIELAAARIRLLAPQALLRRLTNRLTLLTGGARDLPAHQQTLRATIDWSYELLQPAEQTLFRRLAVFVGGHTLPAVEAVCNVKGDLALDVLDSLQSLLDKSLLYQRENPDGEPRFMMLETIREYALERPEAIGEAEPLRRQHAIYFLALAEEAATQMDTSEVRIWLERLAAEEDNLRGALAWCLSASGDANIGLQVAVALQAFWQRRDRLREARGWLEGFLSRTETTSPTALRAQALRAAGSIADAQGDRTHGWALVEQSLAIFRTLNDRHGIGRSLHALSEIALDQGDRAQGIPLAEEALAILREVGDLQAVTWMLDDLARSALAYGDTARGVALLEERLTMLRGLGNVWDIADALETLAAAVRDLGDTPRAVALYRDALARKRDLGSPSRIFSVLLSLGYAMHELGDRSSATAHYQEILALYQQREQTGEDFWESPWTGRNLGHLAHILGDNRRATSLLIESLRKFVGQLEHDLIGIACCMVDLAGILARQGQPQRAAQLFGASQVVRGVESVPWRLGERVDYEHDLAAVRAQLDEAAFAVAWAAGQALTLEQAIAHALGEAA